LKPILKIAALALLHSAVLFVLGRIAVLAWDLPGGVNYGITLYYSFIFLSLLDVGHLILFHFLQPTAALAISLCLIAALALSLLPVDGIPGYTLMFAGSGGFFLSLWIAQNARGRRGSQ